jgi:hypothetical protein
MDPRDFLCFAKSLVNAKPDAVACRIAIGRSYYAVFNVALGMLKELGIPLDKQKDSHWEVARILEFSGDPDIRNACGALTALKAQRKSADYEMDDANVETPQKAGLAVLLAERAIKQLDGVHADAKRWATASANMIKGARAGGKTV